MDTGPVVRGRFGAALDDLQRAVDRLGVMASVAARDAVTSLVADDFDLAREVIARDHRLDEALAETEDRAQVLIAEQQPVARDLRFILAALRVMSDYEKVGNRAAALARGVLGEWRREPDTLVLLGQMGELALGIFDDACRCWRDQDHDLAASLSERDGDLDARYRELIAHLLDLQGPDVGPIVLYAHGAGRNLERIADHGVVVGERVAGMAPSRHAPPGE